MPRRNTTAAYRRRRATRQYPQPSNPTRVRVNHVQLTALPPLASVHRVCENGTTVYAFPRSC